MKPIRQHPAQRAFSLMEVAMASLITGILLAGSLASFAQLHGRQQSMTKMDLADLLAHDLMQEILALPYSEPNITAVSTGPEAGETTRLQFDDVDDYHGLTEVSAQTRTGSAIPDAQRFSRRVTVQFVQPANLTTPAASNQGARRITLFVDYDSQPITSIFAIRTQTDGQIP
jgi:hypothetical protein